MHIIITLAGHSRRFKEAGYDLPKFLIPINGKPMLQHVVDMFDSENDTYHFVVNRDQISERPDLPQWLSTLAPNGSLTVVLPHEQGPTYSALQVKNVPADEPVIVTYCDFIVEWDYEKFKFDVKGYAGSIPAFKGFHPASFGTTVYAYMRVNDRGEMLELREKNSFTDKRQEEPASAGIYYFKDWKTFHHYAERLIAEGYQGMKEGYTSLLANSMIADGLKVNVPIVDKFICWGTPEDLEQYLFWSKYFIQNADRGNGVLPKSKHRQVNLIPMAGKGSRFRQVGYQVAKPLIPVSGRPMAVTSCLSFPQADRWIFLPRADDADRHSLKNVFEKKFPNVLMVPVDRDTSGQAATCLIAKDSLRPDDHLLIASCDYRTVYNTEAWQKIIDDQSIDAAIWTCRLGAVLTKNPKAFAYCITGSDSQTITKIVEKDTISSTPNKDPLVVGTFWFRQAEDFIRSAEAAIEHDMNVNGEHYVANSMNLMLAEGKKLVIFDIEQWISFGDPFELDVYNYWEEHFKNQKNRLKQ